ncbi:TRAP-type C4-dicarboxylate transport system, small permease component [Desulfuromusa kysingii]|uniref:TRAP-type C4-dicarboxylate transport system, small permease component n=1 Tax=Desulfuromusa kysingii TaxID=37625 RepID=A0A1H3VXN4_9BACT|nr:TRAP transporter small permease [Desulfuromusa kysingii]SDZ78808.1 TRAP-type C4-dicarboxylate transport system, small permease component [Desulfuromusa kysingii]
MTELPPEPENKSIMEQMHPDAYIDTSSMSKFEKINHHIGIYVNAVEVSIMVICVAALAILLIANVFARSFHKSLYFADEISVFLVLLITFTGVSYGVRKARHIRMGAFLDMMPPKMEKAFIIGISVISAVVLGIMTWASWKYLLNAYDNHHMSQALRVPKWIFYVIIPIGFGMATLQYIRTIIKNLTEDEPWQSPDQQSEYEDEEIGGV